MNLHNLLAARAQQHHPLRVALIGAGKFGSMFLSQVRRTPGILESIMAYSSGKLTFSGRPASP